MENPQTMNSESVMKKADLISIQIIKQNAAVIYSNNFYGNNQEYWLLK